MVGREDLRERGRGLPPRPGGADGDAQDQQSEGEMDENGKRRRGCDEPEGDEGRPVPRLHQGRPIFDMAVRPPLASSRPATSRDGQAETRLENKVEQIWERPSPLALRSLAVARLDLSGNRER